MGRENSMGKSHEKLSEQARSRKERILNMRVQQKELHTK
jgi:hypothetical protein